MDIFQRLEALEQTCSGDTENLAAQVLELDAQVNRLLQSSGAQNLDWRALGQILNFSDATAPATPYATKRQIVDARATEVLQQTSSSIIGNKLPEIESFDLTIKDQVNELVHHFDESSIRSIHAARMYLERLHSC